MIILMIVLGMILLGVGILALVPTVVGILAPTIISVIVIWIIYRLIRKGCKVIKDKTE